MEFFEAVCLKFQGGVTYGKLVAKQSNTLIEAPPTAIDKAELTNSAVAAALDAIRDGDIGLFEELMQGMHPQEIVFADGAEAVDMRLRLGYDIVTASRPAALPESLKR